MKERDVLFYDFDNFRLDLVKQQLLKNGEPVLLTHKAFQTLQILVQNSGQIVEKENIYNSIWADSFVEEGNLTQYIYLLRKILDKSPEGQPYIETIARRGYLFAASVQKTFADPQDSNTVDHRENGSSRTRPTLSNEYGVSLLPVEPELPQNSLFDEGTEDRVGRTETYDAPERDGASDDSSFGWLRMIVVASAFVAVLFLVYKYSGVATISGRGAAGSVRSLAVLPFKTIGDESRDTKLGFGMADAIITKLSTLQKIPVRSTSSVFKYIDDPPASNTAAGVDLGVDAILEGTVQREGDRIRVTVQLLKVEDGRSLWAEKFDEKYTDVFSLQDSIAARVASSLSIKLTPQQLNTLKRHTTENQAASEAYQLGVYFWNTRTKENLQIAEANFLKAVEYDPSFATAYAMLADTYNMTGYYGFRDRMEMRTKASAAAARALELDDSVAEAHIANAFIQFTPTGVDLARISIERAIEIAPYNSTARLRHAWILLRYNRLDEALAEMRLARDYDPLSAVSNSALCNVLLYKEAFQEAVEVCGRSVELSPNAPLHRLGYANALFFNGNTAEAITEANKDVAEDQDKLAALGNLGFYYATLGRRTDAEAVLAKLVPESKKDPTLLLDLTLITFALGDRDRALSYFKQAYKERGIQLVPFRFDPVWKDVRSDVRFASILSE